MSKSKIRGKKTRISSPFDSSARKTERSAVAVMMHWMRVIIEKKNLDLGLPDVETIGKDRKSPDTVIYESRRSKNVLCVLEAKPPYYDPFDQEELKEPARKKAVRRRAKYFATTNFRRLIWFNTERVNAQESEERQVVDKYILSELEDLDLIEETRYRESIKKELEKFLLKLYAVYTGKEAEPKHAIDEILVFRLQEKISKLSYYYQSVIYDQCHKDRHFSKKLRRWFNEQGWSFAWQQQDFDKAARQTAYLLGNKILFYEALRAKRPTELDPLEIPASLTKGSTLKTQLQGFFQEVLKLDYESIYTTDFIDGLAFPDSKEVVKEIRELVDLVREYDFSKLGYEIIGQIFERLIPGDERHNLGQYFTNPDVVDIILQFCMKHEEDKVLDPACGAGTFLVRAYQHKKLMNQRLRHEDTLATLWGNDIAKFPAHLSTINLAINDLSVDKNYPNILQEDFFSLLSQQAGFELPKKWRMVRAKTLGLEEREVEYPRWFDCIVGNPPYTRQEEISKIAPRELEFKKDVIRSALLDIRGKKLATISKRAGIHAYFFVHGFKFLQNGGRFGFIVSNSWLDVDYGKGLQEFFLKNYKILAIIESKVERWFEEADINTCIIILQKCSDQKERKENLVRFVYLKKKLRYFIPPAQDMWEKQVERIDAIKDLRRTILGHSELYENEDFRIFPKKQAELWEEGFDEEKNKYIGAKWGKYLRVELPDIYFRVLKKGKKVIVPLNQVSEVKPGCYTGINDFFYFQRAPGYEKRIEKEFLVPIIRNSNQVKTCIIEASKLKDSVFVCGKTKQELKKTGKINALQYIEWGENEVTRKRQKVEAGLAWTSVETVRKRKPGWWSIPLKNTLPTKLFMIYVVGNRFIAPYCKDLIPSDRCFHRLFPHKNIKTMILGAILNSTLNIFNIEIYGRSNLGLGALKFEAMDAKRIPIINPNAINSTIQKSIEIAFKEFGKRRVGSIFNELGALSPAEVTLDKVKCDRRELDQIIMGDILGLTDEEQLQVYRAVVDLVKSRIEKAKSFGKRKKTKEGIDIDLLVKTIMDKIGDDTLSKFYKEKILKHKNLSTRKLFKTDKEIRLESGLFGYRLSSGKKKYVDCDTEQEAKYLKIFTEAGFEKVKIPKDKKYLKKILSELESLKGRIDKVINSFLDSILDPKTKIRISHLLWTEIIK